jgi:hypothetical protein
MKFIRSLFFLFAGLYSLTSAASVYNNQCIETVKLSDKELKPIFSTQKINPARFSLFIAQYTALKSQECLQQRALQAGIKEETFTSIRSIRAWSKPILVKNNLCKINYTELNKLDKQWSNPKTRRQSVHAYLLKSSDHQCQDITLDKYIYVDTKITDKELIKLLTYTSEAVKLLSESEKKSKTTLHVTNIGITTIEKNGETYYHYLIAESLRPRPYKVVVDWDNMSQMSIVQLGY